MSFVGNKVIEFKEINFQVKNKGFESLFLIQKKVDRQYSLKIISRVKDKLWRAFSWALLRSFP